MPETQPVPTYYSLALCFRDHPVLVNQAPDELPLSHRVEDRCREENVTCLVDVRNLPPDRSMRSLFRPVPRMQDVVTTVWPDGETLRRVLGGAHGDRETLLPELQEVPHVLYWVPRFSVPALADVEKRIARREALGTSALLGDLARWPEPPSGPFHTWDHPASEAMAHHEARLRADARLAELQYDRRVFTAAANTANGDVRPGLEFDYHEEAGLVWAFYEGSGVELGMLVAVKDEHGRLRMAYQHLTDTDQVRAGHCFSYPEILPDGYLRMHEYWRWSSGDGSAGESQLQEKQGVTIERRVS
ncbi:MAG: hypothetical protein KIT83_12215 [Bryobacterales bacterium]|nr:hypothetical protein [Bryobacterales bacterium]